jgi:hypothetical protein
MRHMMVRGLGFFPFSRQTGLVPGNQSPASRVDVRRPGAATPLMGRQRGRVSCVFVRTFWRVPAPLARMRSKWPVEHEGGTKRNERKSEHMIERECLTQVALQDHRYRESHSALTGRGVWLRQKSRLCVQQTLGMRKSLRVHGAVQ